MANLRVIKTKNPEFGEKEKEKVGGEPHSRSQKNKENKENNI
jgi:hypothetical protein